MNLIQIKSRKSASIHKKDITKEPGYAPSQCSREFFLSSYSYIGEFLCSSGQLTLCDPLSDDVSCAALGITPPENVPVQLQFPVAPGIYRAYYRLFNGEACGLLLIHENTLHPVTEDCTGNQTELRFIPNPAGAQCMDVLENFFQQNPFCVHRLSVSLARCLVAVDSRFAFDPLYSLYELEPEAFYDAVRLHRLLLEESPYDPISLKRLEHYVKNCMETTGFAKGSDLINLTENLNRPWSGYRRVPSTHWGADAVSRAHREVTMIPGGIACDYEDNTPLFLELYRANGRTTVLYVRFRDAE